MDTELTPFYPALIEAFSTMWSVDEQTLTSSQNYLVFDVFMEGLWGDSPPPTLLPECSDIYAIDADDLGDVSPQNALTIFEGETILMKKSDALSVQKQIGDDELVSLVFQRSGGGTLLEALIVLLNAAVRDATEGDYNFEEILVDELNLETVYADFIGSKSTAPKLEKIYTDLGLAKVTDERIRTVLQFTLSRLYVETRFSSEGLESDASLFEHFLGIDDDVPAILKWLNWGRILGEIRGETDTGGRTFLVRID